MSKAKLNESNGMMTDKQRKEITELAEHAACKGVKDKVFEWLDKSVENHTSDVANETINKLKARIQE